MFYFFYFSDFFPEIIFNVFNSLLFKYKKIMYGKDDENKSKEVRRESINDIKIIPENSNYPSFLINTSNLLLFKQKISNITWEKEGKMLLEKNQFNDNDIQIYKMLIYKGCIPEIYRGEFWFITSGAKKEMLEHPNYYNFLLSNYPKEIELPNEHQIELDLKRTFPEDSFFRQTDTINKLRNILLTYSKRNLSIGYVQGFNFIVGRMLKYISNEEKVFWLFTQVIEYILTIDFFSEMAGIMSDVDILVCMLKEKYCPDLINFLREDLLIYIKNILMQWFLSLFILNFPIQAQLLVWDILFVDNKVTLFKTAIYLIKEMKNEILKVNNIESLTILIKNFSLNFKNLNALKFQLILKKYEFNNSYISYNRLFILSEMIERINKNNQFKLEKLKEKVKERNDYCDNSWPYCLYECESYYKIVDYFVLKNNENLEIIDDYCENINNYQMNKIQINKKNEYNFQNILIERIEHVCKEINKKRENTKNSEKNSEDSITSIGTNNSINEKEDNFEENYQKFKRIEKSITSLSYLRNEKRNFKRRETVKLDSYQYFLNKLNKNYHQVSLAKNYVLKDLEIITSSKLNQ